VSTEQGQPRRAIAKDERAQAADSRASIEANAAQAEQGEAQSQSPAREHWRALLAGMSPREALARLLQGDPLELRQRVARRLAERAYLFDANRVHLRALAHCARYAMRYRGSPPLDVWLSQIVDQATLDLLREDVEAERRGAPTDPQEHAALVELARPLGLEPQAMRRVCLAHNLLREPERQAFHALVICGRGLDEVAREQSLSAVEVARRARRGLEAVLIAADKLSEPGAAAHGAQASEPGDDPPRAGIEPAREVQP